MSLFGGNSRAESSVPSMDSCAIKFNVCVHTVNSSTVLDVLQLRSLSVTVQPTLSGTFHNIVSTVIA